MGWPTDFSKDFTSETDNTVNDENGYEHMAGIIGSSDPSLEGIAPNCSIIALQGLTASGRSFSGIENALNGALKTL